MNRLYDRYVFTSTEKKLKYIYGKENYVLPGVGPDQTYKTIFETCLIEYPHMDNLKLMGFKFNEQLTIHHNMSNQVMSFLSSNFIKASIGDEGQKLFTENVLPGLLQKIGVLDESEPEKNKTPKKGSLVDSPKGKDLKFKDKKAKNEQNEQIEKENLKEMSTSY
jgi:hypothetical protein